MITTILILIVGFAILILGADWLVKGASALGRRLRISELVVGLTVVAFGTSAPELFINVFSIIDGNYEMALGNIVGSNLFNVLFILGVSALIYPLTVSRETVRMEIPFSLGVTLVLALLVNDSYGQAARTAILGRGDGWILIVFFLLFLLYIGRSIQRGTDAGAAPQDAPRLWTCIWMAAGGLAGLIVGAKLVVLTATTIAAQLGISQTLIGLTIVAVGTSLPELATSVVAALRKNSDIAMGNIVGSNIFNICLILGVSSWIHPLPMPLSMNSDIALLIGVSALLLIFMFIGKRYRLGRWEGASLLLSYMMYTVFIVQRG